MNLRLQRLRQLRFGRQLCLLLIIVLASIAPAHLLAGGMMTVPILPFSLAEDTASREIVPLSLEGNMLIGHPKHPNITEIAVVQPLSNDGRLVLQSRRLPDGGIFLHITASPEVVHPEHTIHVVVKFRDQEAVILQHIKEGWQLAPEMEALSGHFLHSGVRRFLLYGTGSLLLTTEPRLAEFKGSKTYASYALRRNPALLQTIGLLHLFLPIALLTTLSVLSRAIFRLQQRFQEVK